MIPEATVKLFISYARADDTKFVSELVEALRSQEAVTLLGKAVQVWWDSAEMPSRGRTFLQELRDAIEAADRVIVVYGPAFAASPYCAAELEHAELFAKGIVTVMRAGGHHSLPPALRHLHAVAARAPLQPSDVLPELLRLLREEVAPLGPLLNDVPALAPHLIPRGQDLLRLKSAVLADIERPTVFTAASSVIGLHGMGGIGKSALAAAFCRMVEVRRAFPGGIAWVAVGEQMQPIDAMHAIAAAMPRNPESDGTSAAAALQARLAKRICLIVLDDVWHLAVASAVRNVLGPRCRLLITTRDDSIARRLQAQDVVIETLATAAARELLGQWAGIAPDMLPPEADEIVRRCGNLPLALAMAGASSSSHGGLANTLALLRRSPDYLHQELADYRYRSVATSLQASLRAFDDEHPIERHAAERYLDFGLFPEDVTVPADVPTLLWQQQGMPRDVALALIALYERRSLLQRRPGGGLLLHDLQRDFAHSRLPNAALRHSELVEAYRARAAGGWTRLRDDGYVFRWLPWHLAEAGRQEELRTLLLDPTWLRAQIGAVGPRVTAEAFDLLQPQESLARLAQGALFMSATALASRPDELAAQLTARLAARHEPEVRRWLEALWAAPAAGRGFRPLRSSLAPCGQRLVRRFTEHADAVLSVTFTPDNRRIVSGALDGSLKVWLPASGEVERRLHGHNDAVTALGLDQHARVLVSGSRDETLLVWDFDSGLVLHMLKAHRAWISAVVVRSDGRLAVSASLDGTLAVWNLDTGALMHRLRGHVVPVLSVVFTADQRCALSAASDGSVGQWDLATGQKLAFTRHAGERWYALARPTCGAEGHSNGEGQIGVDRDDAERVNGTDEALFIAGAGGRVGRITPDGTSFHALPDAGHEQWVHTLALTADADMLLSAGDGAVLRCQPLRGGSAFDVGDHTHWIQAAAVTSDGRFAASAAYGGDVKVWDLHAREALLPRDVDLGGDTSRRAWLANDGSRIVFELEPRPASPWITIQKPGGLLVCNLGETAGSAAIACGTEMANVIVSAVASNCRRAVTVDAAFEATVWDLDAAAPLNRLSAPALGRGGARPTVRIDHAGHQALLARGSQLMLIDLESGRGVRKWTAHKGSFVSALCWLPDGEAAVSSGGDGSLLQWHIVQTEKNVLRSSGAPVKTLRISDDGSVLYVRSEDRVCELWQLPSGQALARGHEGLEDIVAEAVCGESRTLLVAASNGTVELREAGSFARRQPLPRAPGVLESLTPLPGGAMAIGLMADGRGVLWDLTRLSLKAHIRTQPRAMVAADVDEEGPNLPPGGAPAAETAPSAGGLSYSNEGKASLVLHPRGTSLFLLDGDCLSWWDTRSASQVASFTSENPLSRWLLSSDGSHGLLIQKRRHAEPHAVHLLKLMGEGTEAGDRKFGRSPVGSRPGPGPVQDLPTVP